MSERHKEKRRVIRALIDELQKKWHYKNIVPLNSGLVRFYFIITSSYTVTVNVTRQPQILHNLFCYLCCQ